MPKGAGMAKHQAQDPSRPRMNKTMTLTGAALVAGGLLLAPVGVSALSPVANAKKFCPTQVSESTGHCDSGTDTETAGTSGMTGDDTSGCTHEKAAKPDAGG